MGKRAETYRIIPFTEPMIVPFVGIIKKKDFNIEILLPFLTSLFSKNVVFSKTIPFSFTDYYEKEMGKNLERLWIGFLKTFPLENSHIWKIVTNSIENFFKEDNKRTVNIDPGYLSLNNIILFTTKNYTHRFYLGQSIYGEVTLIYKKGKLNKLEWTYPDYTEQIAIDFFNKLREFLKNAI